MAKLNERPIMFALSYSTEKAECTAAHAYTWTKGKALYADGVQFPDVTVDGSCSSASLEAAKVMPYALIVRQSTLSG